MRNLISGGGCWGNFRALLAESLGRTTVHLSRPLEVVPCAERWALVTDLQEQAFPARLELANLGASARLSVADIHKLPNPWRVQSGGLPL